MQSCFLLEGPDLVRTAISPRYVPGWGMAEALREVLQEWVDTRRRYGCDGEVSWKKGFAAVEDAGPGFPRAALALGFSDKRERPDLAGQFGEGLKLAALVAARSGRRMEIETVGFTAVPAIAADPVLGCDVLTFTLTENSRTIGTRVLVECTREEYRAARQCFLDLDGSRLRVLWQAPEGRPAVMLPGGRVFVNGVLAQARDDMMFSYDLGGNLKLAQNRDRTVVDEVALGRAVREVLASCRSVRVARMLLASLDTGQVFYEHRAQIIPCKEALPLWKRALRAELGPRVARSDSTPADEELRSTYRYRVLHQYPWQWDGLFDALEVYRSSRVLASMRRRFRRRVRLSEAERKVLRWVRRVVRKHVADPGRVVVVEELAAGDAWSDATESLGQWDSEADVIRLCRHVLSDPRRALGVLVHEVLHRESDACDCTRAFERAWEELVVKLMLKRARMPVT